MTLQTTSSLVTVGGLTFGLFDDLSMTGWTYSNLQGWYDGPSVRAQYVSRAFTDGSFDTLVFRDVRTITLTGTYVGSSYLDAVAQAQALAACLGDGSAGTFTVDGLSATVRIAAEPVLGWIGDNSAFNFAISFAAVDPRKYGATITAVCGMPSTGGGLVFPLFIVSGVITWGTVPAPQVDTLTNTGTAAAAVTFTVAAGATPITGGFQITEQTTGSILRYVDDLPAGSSVVLDSATGNVTLNGTADRRGSLSVAQWTQIPANSTRLFVLGGLSGFSSTATLTAVTRPAYW